MLYSALETIDCLVCKVKLVFVSDIAVFVLKRTLNPNQPNGL